MLKLYSLVPNFLIAFLVGVFLASCLLPSAIIAWYFFFLAGVLLALSLFFKEKRLIVIAICFIGLALGIFRFMIWHDAPTDPTLDAHTKSFVTLTGVVSDEPDVREGKTHLTIELQSLGDGASSQKVFGTLLAIADRYPEFQYGDRVLLRGKLASPEIFTEADGRVFDYPTYLRTKDIRYEMMFPRIESISVGNGNVLVATLFMIKHGFEGALSHALPEPHNALMGGLLLGGKQSLGADWLMRFRIAGIIHIVVLSGYNMTVVADWLVFAFRFLGFFPSLSIGGVGIILFAIMTGGGATVMRAAIMSILALLARATGRTFTMGRALLIAGALMVLQNPSILLFDPSFQLSFLASLGLVFVAPIVERHITIWKNHPSWREVLVSTLATQITVLPVLLYQTGMLSLVALPVNLLVLPIIPLTMLLGFTAGIITFVIPALGFVVGLPAYMLLSWILNVAQFASTIPHAALALPISSVAVFVLYALMVFLLWGEHKAR